MVWSPDQFYQHIFVYWYDVFVIIGFSLIMAYVFFVGYSRFIKKVF